VKLKTGLAVICSLMISGSVLAQAGPRNPPNGPPRTPPGLEGRNPGPPPHAGRPAVRAVPELDGNMAFLALGLTVAVGALVREKRRKA
jgi:hypothetical protein